MGKKKKGGKKGGKSGPAIPSAAPEEFLKNLGTAAKSLQQALPKVLSFIAEKPFQA